MSESEASRAPRRMLMVGLAVALLVLIADQASKFWVLHSFNLASKGVVPILPFFDLLLVWNKGISYGLFQMDGLLGQIALTGFKIVAAIVLFVWLMRAKGFILALGLGLLIGGALGNAIDRLLYGAVADFALLHAQIGGQRYDWYIFNLADVAIVAGVIGLLYDMAFGHSAAKAP